MTKKYDISTLAMWVFPILLVVPNAMLAYTEAVPVIYKISGIMLPLGVYLLVLSLSRRVGRTIVLCLPLMFYAAFQIVLIYLYGGSVIAIDMFLNVATTNVSEAGELLGSLAWAIALVLLLYLPPIVYGIYAWCKRRQAAEGSILKARRTGAVIAGFGVVMLALCYIGYPHYDVRRDLFPVNAMSNTIDAIDRAHRSAEHKITSENYAYGAKCERPDSVREIYVLVVGETSRADNWQLFGYDRPTNPRLSQRTDLITYPYALSESNTTHKSVPMILSPLDSRTFGDSIYTTRGIFTAFNEAGYQTVYLSDQHRNHSFIDDFGEEADTAVFIRDDEKEHYDDELLPLLRQAIAERPSGKTFIALHTYGSHFDYLARYPREFAMFQPDDYACADQGNRNKLINAYDNSIAYTDCLLDSVIGMLDSVDCPSAMLYLSDHGEDIFDDARERFLHASPTPTYYQVHVPVILWMSPEAVSQSPRQRDIARSLRNRHVSSTRVAFNTMLDLAGITSPRLDSTQSLVSDKYAEDAPSYINDYNEYVALANSGLKAPDMQLLSQMRQPKPATPATNLQTAQIANNETLNSGDDEIKFPETKSHNIEHQAIAFFEAGESFQKRKLARKADGIL